MEWVVLAGGAITIAILAWYRLSEVYALLEQRRLALEARSIRPKPTDTTLN